MANDLIEPTNEQKQFATFLLNRNGELSCSLYNFIPDGVKGLFEMVENGEAYTKDTQEILNEFVQLNKDVITPIYNEYYG